MTSTQVVKMSVTNNGSFENYPHLDDHKLYELKNSVFDYWI